jgi:glycosyltransferase involved in cell wall biosynthesis
MSVSACIITWNEEEMLPGLLAYLDSLKYVNEICILDSNSTDRTRDMLNVFRPQGKNFKWDTCEFLGFGPHRQKNLDMATGDWILFFDADEVICNIDDLLVRLPQMSEINTVQFQGLIIYPDKKHALAYSNGDWLGAESPVPKMVRNGFAHFTVDRLCHEQLIDTNGRILYGSPGPDILRTCDHPDFQHVLIKHMTLLKSRQSRFAKGQRWLETGMIQESAKHGIPVYLSWWAEAEDRIQKEIMEGKYQIKEIPKEYWDITTEG